MIGYGVASRSMVYYPPVNDFTSAEQNPIDPSFDGRSVFRQVISPVYFFLHGEFGDELDNLDSRIISMKSLFYILYFIFFLEKLIEMLDGRWQHMLYSLVICCL